MFETLFFKCYYACLKNNLKECKLYYELLKDEFKLRGNVSSLTKVYLIYLKEVKSVLDTGYTKSKAILDGPVEYRTDSKKDISKTTQKVLVHKIHTKGFNDLKDILKDPELSLYNIEHPLPPYGRVDMMYKGKETVYPLEVKKNVGEHDLIGQIGKYELACKLKLHLKQFIRIRPVTLCRTYDTHTLKELKSLNVCTLIYTNTRDSFRIKKV